MLEYSSDNVGPGGREGGTGPRPQSQDHFGIAGIRTRANSGIRQWHYHCATPAWIQFQAAISPQEKTPKKASIDYLKNCDCKGKCQG